MRNFIIHIATLKRLLFIAAGLFVFSGMTAQSRPDKPEIQRVSIDTSYQGTGYRFIIEWLPSSSPGIELYYIRKDTLQDAFTNIDSVPSAFTNRQFVLSELEDRKYTVVAKDSLGNESLNTPGVHRAVLLNVLFDTCNQANILSWNHYEGWGDNLSGYRIFVAEGCSNSFYLETTVSPTSTTFIHDNITENSCYKYLIESVKNQDNLISHSNIREIHTFLPQPPSYISIDYVDVIDNASIKLSFTADISGQIRDFQLLRSLSADDDFLIRETFRNISQKTITIMDAAATSGKQYFYRLDAIYQPEGCYNSRTVASSNLCSTILLAGEENNNIVSLIWTPYQEYISGLKGYIISRKISDEFIEVVEVGASTTHFNEDIQSIMNGPQSGEITYQVKAIAVSNPDGTPGFESHSNTIAIELNTALFMPNAFTPNGDGNNDIFKPIIDFAPKSFLMIIYDRAGGKLFQTTDPYAGWDGSFRGGDRVMEGVYVYHVQYTDFTSLTKSLTGTVTVIYP